jgi:hypothetical protein
MYCRTRTREKCPSHHKPLQDSGRQAVEAKALRISESNQIVLANKIKISIKSPKSTELIKQ